MSQRKGWQCNVVCLDVAKAFDKVWHRGFGYKLLHLDLPLIIEKILGDYIKNRKACIKYRGDKGEDFDLHSGVPQGSILAPTPYSLYTADLPPPTHHGDLDVIFADDITQVIVDPNVSTRYIARKTEREIQRVNSFERKWKIKTSMQKFQLLAISKLKPGKVEVEGLEISFKTQA